MSCDGDSLRKELISDNESRIAGLANRAKYMNMLQTLQKLQKAGLGQAYQSHLMMPILVTVAGMT